MEKTKGLSCPGEAKCLLGKESKPLDTLIIGGAYGQLRKRTLENYCHKEVATAKNGLQQGCPLFDTKSDNMSEALTHSVDTAEQFRNFKELGLLPSLNEISAYEFVCYDTAERAVRKINDEQQKAANKKSSAPTQTPPGVGEEKQKTGARPPR